MLDFFPHEKPRNEQLDLIRAINNAVSVGNNVVVHAPTGLGKTAASLAPAILHAKKQNKKVFFLTSRHSQHAIAIKTIRGIKGVTASNLLGKVHMCLQTKASKLNSSEFPEYCANLKADKMCEFYERTYKENKDPSNFSNSTLQLLNIGSSAEIINRSRDNQVCPYEIGMIKAKNADVIIADYYYIFSPKIRETLFAKIGIDLSDCIVIVDEAHNLPDRIKDLMSSTLTNRMIERGIRETEKYDLSQARAILEMLHNQVNSLHARGERLVNKDELNYTPEEIIILENATKFIRDEQERSAVGGIAQFLTKWAGKDDGFSRIINVEDNNDYKLMYKCLDPSLVSGPISKEVHSMILMSGTLSPVNMYAELLGIDNPDTAEFKSPFPQSNKLNIIIPKTSTKYEKRTPEMFKEIAGILGKILSKVPGNSAIFFPSYWMKDQIKNKIISSKTVFDEMQQFSTHEKSAFIERFKEYHDKGNGAVLYGVMGGNFGEGVDLPGTYLNGVVIVGLPLTKPDLETEQLIKYYDGKFKKGWDYGYLFPAFNKTLQSAGRCIRSETDKGVVVFLDERYIWNNYYRCFPSDSKPKVSLLFEGMIEGFFNQDLSSIK